MPGAHERVVEVAGLRFRFRGDAAAAAVIDARYEAFRRPASGEALTTDIELAIRDAVIDPAQGDVELAEDAEGIHLRGSGMTAEVSSDAERAAITTYGAAPLDVLFRLLLATHLSSRGGLLAHASAVEREGGAWVFCGPSGAGKSTIAAHLGGRLLCDEAVALVRDGESVSAHATPYWRAVPRSAPVAGLVFPQRGSETAWREMTPARAAARLLAQAGPLLDRDRPGALAVAAAITRTVSTAEVTLSSVDDIASWLQPRLDPPDS